MKLGARSLGFAAALIVLGLVGCRRGGGPATTGDEVKVVKGEVVVEVVETGAIEASRVVELKSRVSGRVKTILAEEGDVVTVGDLISEIDPQETALQVEQNRAQLRGAQAAVQRTNVEISQRRDTLSAQLQQAIIRVEQIRRELRAQPELTQSGIKAAEAGLDAARTTKQQLVVSSHPNERTALMAELEQAQSNLDTSERELDRLKTLLAREFVSQREVDNQQLQVDLARSRVRSAQERVNRLAKQHQTELRAADDRIRQSEAELRRARANSVQDFSKQRDLESAEAAVRIARASLKDIDALIASRAQSQASADQIATQLRDSERQLSETEIRAPINGVVTAKLIQEGELVSSLNSFSGGTPIVRLEDRSSMLVKLNVNEIDAAKLRVGMRTRVNVDALPTREFVGRVGKIAPTKVTVATPGDSVVRFAVEVVLDKPVIEIKSGMTAKVTVEAVRRTGVLTIPADHLVTDGAETFVLVPSKDKADKKPVRQKVQIGQRSNSRIEILSGVAEGTVIVRPDFDGPSRRGFGPNGGD